MTDPRPAPNPAQGIWKRFRGRYGHRQNTAEIARRTGLAEHIVERIVAQYMDARFARRPMPWSEGG